MDPFTAAATVVLLGAGWLLGRANERWRQRRAAPPPPICICSPGNDKARPHTYGAHDEKTGRCLAAVKRSTANHAEWVPCPCQRYTGPVPITDAIWVPPVAAIPDQPYPRKDTPDVQ